MSEANERTDTPEPEPAAAVPATDGHGDPAPPCELRTPDGHFVSGHQPTGARWKPGQTGNPMGSSKKQRLTKALVEALEQNNGELAQGLIRAAIKHALAGNFKYFQEIFNRSDGTLALRLAGHDGGQLLPDARAQEELDAMMTHPEIMAAARALGELMSEQKAVPPAEPLTKEPKGDAP
jgi:hypothetical protein